MPIKTCSRQNLASSAFRPLATAASFDALRGRLQGLAANFARPFLLPQAHAADVGQGVRDGGHVLGRLVRFVLGVAQGDGDAQQLLLDDARGGIDQRPPAVVVVLGERARHFGGAAHVAHSQLELLLQILPVPLHGRARHLKPRSASWHGLP